MRKVTLSVLSFGLGALAMSLLGNHTSTLAQEPKSGGAGSIRIVGAIPVVPPFRGSTVENLNMEGSRFAIDGILCRNCRFKGTTFEYGGGEFSFESPKVELPISIDLVGAARNTTVFLNMFGLLGCPASQAPPTVPQTPPILRAKYIVSGDLKTEHTQ